MLAGNGLSIAANGALRLDLLTQEFLERHVADRDDLDRLVEGAGLDPRGRPDFETIVAGLEVAEEVIGAFMGLAGRVGHPDLEAAADLLEERGVPELARRLYYAYCAEVLDAIGERARVPFEDGLLSFAAWLGQMYEAHEQMSLFTLNYDVLLERLLIDDEVLGLQWNLTDLFSGREDRQGPIQLVPGEPPIQGHLFFPEDPPPGRMITLHHLHGCLTHFRRVQDGSIWKFDSASLRALGIFQHLAQAREARYSPAVILGSRKVAKARDWPFSHAFMALGRDLLSARTVAVRNPPIFLRHIVQ